MGRAPIVAVCAAAMISAFEAEASTIRYVFDWTATSGIATSDATMRATGHLDLDETVGAGEAFGVVDLAGISIAVTGDTIADIVFDDTSPDIFLAGALGPDGRTASLVDFFIGTLGVTGFGCDVFGCARTVSTEGIGYNVASGRTPGGVLGTTLYASPSDALASFGLERAAGPPPAPAVEVVPLPASAPLLLGGLAALAWWHRRQKRRAH